MREGEGIVLEVREYGNSSSIVKILTKDGKLGGFLKGGLKRKDKILPFSLVNFKLSRRLEEHLGVLNIEVIKTFYSTIIKDRIKLAILCSIQEIFIFLFSEESPEGEVYNNTINLLGLLVNQNATELLITDYLKFELFLISTLGFGLDFSRCALTDEREVFFISPLTGKCASFNAGERFKEKLFTIPLIYGNEKLSPKNTKGDLINAFKINSHFLQNVHNFNKLTSRQKILAYLEVS